MSSETDKHRNTWTAAGPHELFRWFAHTSSDWAGEPLTFLAALLIVVIWLFSGPYFHYSGTWQLVINTGTSVII